MPWRLIVFVICLVLVTFFIGFNLGNVSDISFGFYTFSDVPIFMSMLLSFAVGMLIMMPFTFGRRKKKDVQSAGRRKKEKAAAEVSAAAVPPESGGTPDA